MAKFNIHIVKKEVKNLTVKVKPTGEVILTAPVGTPDEYIQKVIKKRTKWIDSKLTFFKQTRRPIKELVSGENFEYLGRNYRLKIYQSKKEYAKLQRGYFEVYVKNKNDFKRKEKLVYDWYYEKALFHFYSILLEFNKITKQEIYNLRIRQMKTRWGSCNSHNKLINLNLDLIKKSKNSIEYVIFHELIHLIHSNHSPEFYNYLTLYMPDWKERKGKLENIL